MTDTRIIAFFLTVDIVLHAYALMWMFKAYRRGLSDGIKIMIDNIYIHSENAQKQ